MIPLSQVVSGFEMAWEDPLIIRRDRMPTITVLADAQSTEERRAEENRRH